MHGRAVAYVATAILLYAGIVVSGALGKNKPKAQFEPYTRTAEIFDFVAVLCAQQCVPCKSLNDK